MTERQAYKVSLALPLLTSALAFGVLAVAKNSLSSEIDNILRTTLGAGLIGFIPYVILCTWILWWTQNRSIKTLKITLMMSPWLMIILVILFLLILSYLVDGKLKEGWEDYPEVILVYGGFCLIYGYAYILIVFPLLWFLKVRGYVEQEILKDTPHTFQRSA